MREKKKKATFGEIRDDNSIYTVTCPGARAENKESKGKDRTRVRGLWRL